MPKNSKTSPSLVFGHYILRPWQALKLSGQGFSLGLFSFGLYSWPPLPQRRRSKKLSLRQGKFSVCFLVDRKAFGWLRAGRADWWPAAADFSRTSGSSCSDPGDTFGRSGHQGCSRASGGCIEVSEFCSTWKKSIIQMCVRREALCHGNDGKLSSTGHGFKPLFWLWFSSQNSCYRVLIVPG